jgi:hypothetical protein
MTFRPRLAESAAPPAMPARAAPPARSGIFALLVALPTPFVALPTASRAAFFPLEPFERLLPLRDFDGDLRAFDFVPLDFGRELLDLDFEPPELLVRFVFVWAIVLS